MSLQRFRTGRLCAVSFAAWMASAAAHPSPRTAVVDLLRELSATGVGVLYSSELVPSDLGAPEGLPPGDPLTRAEAALAANHLTLKRAGDHSYIVTRAPPAAAALAVPRAAPAGRVGAEPNQPPLDDISVFASRYEFVSVGAGEPVGFGERDIDQSPGAQTDPIRALRAVPGLATNASARPYVRGALLDDVLVEYDGVALADPFHFRSFQSVLSVFNPSTVSRADVYTGGYPVKYGSRSGGVLDLTPQSVASGSEYAVGANLLTYDLETMGQGTDVPVEWLLVGRLSSDRSVLQRLLSEFGEPQFSDVVGRLKWTIDDASSLTLGWILLDDKVTLTSGTRAENASAHSRDVDTWLRWDWAPVDGLRTHSTLSLTNTERYNSGALLLPGLATGTLRAERSFTDVGARSEWTYTPSRAVTWNFGGEYTHESAQLVFMRQETFADPIAALFGRAVDASMNSSQSLHSSTAGLFSSVQGHWHAFEAELGLRADGQAYQGYGTRGQMSPRVNLRYDFADRWHAYGAWGQFTQAQRVDEYRAEAHQTTPDSAYRAAHAIVGMAVENREGSSWRVETYEHHWSSIGPYFDNWLGPISILPQLEPDRVLIAPSDANAAGIEISVQRPIGHAYNAWAGYSYSRVTDHVDGRDVLRSWDQLHSANLGLAWTGRRTTVSALLGWHSGWPRTPLAIMPATDLGPAYVAIGERNSARWSSYLSGGLRLTTTLPLRSGDLSLWLDATNVTNRTNYCCVDLNPMNPPSGVPTAENKVWSPRLVNVGFTWRVRRP